MSKRAEEAATKAYPIQGEWVGDQYGEWDGDINRELRKAFLQGYEQAEKDTIERVCTILNDYVAEDLTLVIEYLCKAMEEE